MGWIVRAAVMMVTACASRSAPLPPPPPRVAILASPGPLSSGHAALDVATGCNDCHVDNTREVAAARCLGCHDHGDLSARIAAGTGLHASVVVAGKPCEACHLEHRGRHYDAMGWSGMRGGQLAFDHDLTGWPLAGGHRATACADCHLTTSAQGLPTFAGTARLCGSCHRASPHGFARRELLACDRCHSERTWKPALSRLAFDHDNRADARVPLRGPHRDLACAACHPAARFTLALAAPAGCDSCHRNAHPGDRFAGRTCTACHAPDDTTFAAVSAFDHTATTGFDLAGHRGVPCTGCHTRAARRGPVPCAGCHSYAEVHADGRHPPGRFANAACLACHAGGGVPPGLVP